MTYAPHNPSDYEKDVIEQAYSAQRQIGNAITRFVMPSDPTPPRFGADGSDPINEKVPSGEIQLAAVNIAGKEGPSPVDGDWDKVTYDGEEWLVKDGVVLKRVAT